MLFLHYVLCLQPLGNFIRHLNIYVLSGVILFGVLS